MNKSDILSRLREQENTSLNLHVRCLKLSTLTAFVVLMLFIFASVYDGGFGSTSTAGILVNVGMATVGIYFARLLYVLGKGHAQAADSVRVTALVIELSGADVEKISRLLPAFIILLRPVDTQRNPQAPLDQAISALREAVSKIGGGAG